jgi:DNA-binding NarL/FixJ family response regulator
VREAKSNREIAAALSLSEKTIKRYMTILMQKVNVKNRVQLAIYAQKYMDRE